MHGTGASTTDTLDSPRESLNMDSSTRSSAATGTARSSSSGAPATSPACSVTGVDLGRHTRDPAHDRPMEPSLPQVRNRRHHRAGTAAVGDIVAVARSGRTAVVLGFQNTSPFEDDLGDHRDLP
jgi:microsomal dipeptidase-like Zn-dependent dipeptidase